MNQPTLPAAVLAAFLLLGCPGPPPAAVCADLCDELMGTCGFEAYPDRASCEEGCAYDVASGAQIRTLHACVVDAACDTPTVLQCARSFGGAP